MSIWRCVWISGLTGLVLAGCGTYRDPNYEPFEVSLPERLEPREELIAKRAPDPVADQALEAAAQQTVKPIASPFLEALLPAEVATIQSFLNANGFVAGLETGDFNHRTSTAIRAYQKANGLSTTGLPDQALLTAAYSYFGDTMPHNPAREAYLRGEDLEAGVPSPTPDPDGWVTPDF